MFDSAQIEKWQPQKKVSLLLIRCTVILLSALLGARFLPPINDWISGPAEPVRAIAEQLAKGVAAATGKEGPVIVIHSENVIHSGNQNCQNAQHDSSTDYYVTLYVITYSEQSRAVCLTTYVHFLRNQQANTVLISESMGRNYGYPLPAPIKAMPAGNRLTTYPQQYLSLLHWRTTPKFPLQHAQELYAHTRHYAPNEDGSTTHADLELDFQQMRASVAARHNAVNRKLMAALGLLSIVLLILSGWTWMIFRSLQGYCRSYDFTLSPRMYLRDNLAAISELARRQYLAQQQEVQEQLRSQNLLKRSMEDARERLQFLLEAIADENIRAEIMSCLERNQLEEMSAVYQQYQSQAGHKTHEEKLSLLLESLKPYCSPEEFENHRNESIALLRQSGFREARNLVVSLHVELRARYKKSVEEVSTTQELEEKQREPSEGIDGQ